MKCCLVNSTRVPGKTMASNSTSFRILQLNVFHLQFL